MSILTNSWCQECDKFLRSINYYYNYCLCHYHDQIIIIIIIIIVIIIIIIKSLVKSLYTDFKTSILTNEFRTPFISVGRGVLQGDWLSPLLFKLWFNMFLQHINSEKYRQFGFSLKFLNPIHWFQFADDAAVIKAVRNQKINI